MSLRTHNLFISHSWNYGDAYEKLLNILDQRGNFSYKDYSVPKDDPIHNAKNDAELEKAIEAKIVMSSVVIIMAGVYSSYSKWIDKEIEIAKRLQKTIIAVEPWGSEKTSTKVKESADKIVKWQADSIVDAIREFA